MFKWQHGDLYVLYACLGVVMSSPVVIIRFAFVERYGMSVSDLSYAFSLIALPWAFKPLYGVLSDSIGFPKLQLGFSLSLSAFFWVLSSLFGISVAFLSISSLSLAYFDVVLDGLLINRVSREKVKGTLQSFCWAARSTGSLCGTLLSGLFARNSNALSYIFLIHLIVLLLLIPLKSRHKGATSNALCRSVREILKPRARMLTLCLWVFAFTLSHEIVLAYDVQVNRAADPIVFAVADAVAFLATIAASFTFQKCFIKENPNKVVAMSLALNMLITSITLYYLLHYFPKIGEMFALSTFYWIDSFTGHLAFLPLAIVAADVCVTGLEATMYSFFMAITNLSGIAVQALTGQILTWLGTKTFRLEHIDVFYLLTILSQFISLLVVWYILNRVKI